MVVPGAPQPSRAAAGRGPLGLRSRRGGLAIRRAARGAGARGAGRGAAAGADQHAPWRPREGGNGLGGRPWETGGLPRGAGAGCAVRQGSGLSQVSWEGPEGRSSKYRTGIHLMAGRVPQGADRAAVRGEMETVFLENLKYAAGVLAQENLVGMLEPINTRITDPQYFLDTPQQAAAILQKVGRPNLQLQMDIFHWQIMDGNLTGNIREFLPIVGHVQVAQVPGRGEPGSSGELDFSYLFQLLEDEGYEGFVGCEYKPQGDTIAGLSWLRSYWDRRGHPQDGR
ncbi:putative hydroxypyruvate isomerase isoform X3 [Castor canadensis]|uniref:Hydroxypyruvate isomerase isoform X2 n=1 Tax=Castor canadensis TaxID=51338 RepID=A0A8B7VI40_CASCN|nr:putative hydroxypyruvate isomerase isoform X2 [Castor canadensis]